MEGVLNTVTSNQWILIGTVVIAVLSVLVVLATLLLPSEADNHELRTTEAAQVSSDEFIEMLSGLTNSAAVTGAEPRILNNGDEFMPALIDRINAASSTINFTTFIWSEGKMSDMLFDALIAAANRGVEVRILVDGFGGSPPAERTKELEAAGGKLVEYKPIGFNRLLEYYKRTHRRAIVIDGSIGYVGGIAVADEWLGGGKKPNEWREVMIEVYGPVAKLVQNGFADIWTETTGEVLVGDSFYPEFPDPAGDTVYIHIVSSPSETSQSVRAMLLLTVLGSEERLYITNPYLLPDDQTLQALQDRARAGVDVRILVPSLKGWQPVLISQQVHYKPLLEAGVRIYEYNEYVHSKTVVADGIWSTVGSANIDSRSRVLNDENILGIRSAEFARALEDTFMRDLEFANELTLEEWEDRPFYIKALAHISYLFAKQY